MLTASTLNWGATSVASDRIGPSKNMYAKKLSSCALHTSCDDARPPDSPLIK